MSFDHFISQNTAGENLLQCFLCTRKFVTVQPCIFLYKDKYGNMY